MTLRRTVKKPTRAALIVDNFDPDEVDPGDIVSSLSLEIENEVNDDRRTVKKPTRNGTSELVDNFDEEEDGEIGYNILSADQLESEYEEEDEDEDG